MSNVIIDEYNNKPSDSGACKGFSMMLLRLQLFMDESRQLAYYMNHTIRVFLIFIVNTSPSRRIYYSQFRSPKTCFSTDECTTAQ